jgi:hypothetical protein
MRTRRYCLDCPIKPRRQQRAADENDEQVNQQRENRLPPSFGFD